MIDVHDPHGDEDQAAAQIEAPPQQGVEVGLLDLDLAVVIRRRDGVLDLDLRVEPQPLVEVVADVEDEATQVDHGGGVGRGVQRQLAVAADGRPGQGRRLRSQRAAHRRLAGERGGGGNGVLRRQLDLRAGGWRPTLRLRLRRSRRSQHDARRQAGHRGGIENDSHNQYHYQGTPPPVNGSSSIRA